MHAQHQLFGIERLGQVIVGAQLQGGQPVLAALALGYHDDRDRRARPDLAGQGQAVFVGQPQIKKDQIDVLGIEGGHHFFSGSGVTDFIALALHIGGEQRLNQFVVFDNEKMICYARAYPRNDFQSKPEANPGETQIYMNLHLVHNLFIRAQHRAPISKSRERGKTELVR